MGEFFYFAPGEDLNNILQLRELEVEVRWQVPIKSSWKKLIYTDGCLMVVNTTLNRLLTAS